MQPDIELADHPEPGGDAITLTVGTCSRVLTADDALDVAAELTAGAKTILARTIPRTVVELDEAAKRAAYWLTD